MTFDQAEYLAHLSELAAQWEDALPAEGFDAVAIPAGEAQMYFLPGQMP